MSLHSSPGSRIHDGSARFPLILDAPIFEARQAESGVRPRRSHPVGYHDLSDLLSATNEVNLPLIALKTHSEGSDLSSYVQESPPKSQRVWFMAFFSGLLAIFVAGPFFYLYAGRADKDGRPPAGFNVRDTKSPSGGLRRCWN